MTPLKPGLLAAIVMASAAAFSQVNAPIAAPVVLMDSTGKVAARPINETQVLLTVGSLSAPASIGPVYGADGRSASGQATWQAGGSVLFTSADCSAGPHIFSPGHAGLRATTQVETPDGIMLFVGAVGATTTVAVRSILYASGCSPVTVLQNGLVAVEARVNLTATYPPPLSFQ